MDRPMTLIERLRNPQRIEGGQLDTEPCQRDMSKAADYLERYIRAALKGETFVEFDDGSVFYIDVAPKTT